MAKTKRPSFRVNDLVTLAAWTPLIPSYRDSFTGQTKPFVGREKILRVASVSGTGSMRNPWFLKLTDDEGHDWTLPPADVELVAPGSPAKK